MPELWGNTTMSRGSKTTGLRDRLDRALRLGRHEEALKLYTTLERLERNEPRWPRRKGHLLERMNRNAEAIQAYDHAAELYAAQGFLARAAAMSKVGASVATAR